MKQLLHILEENARISLEDLSALLDLSLEDTSKKLDEALSKGYIHGFQALVDYDKADINQVEALIELHVSPKKSRGFNELANTIASFDEVNSVFLMSGSYDLLVTIKGDNFQEIALFVANRLSTLDDVLSTSTSFVLKVYKRGNKLYQLDEQDDREQFLL